MRSRSIHDGRKSGGCFRKLRARRARGVAASNSSSRSRRLPKPAACCERSWATAPLTCPRQSRCGTRCGRSALTCSANSPLRMVVNPSALACAALGRSLRRPRRPGPVEELQPELEPVQALSPGSYVQRGARGVRRRARCTGSRRFRETTGRPPRAPGLAGPAPRVLAIRVGGDRRRVDASAEGDPSVPVSIRSMACENSSRKCSAASAGEIDADSRSRSGSQ